MSLPKLTESMIRAGATEQSFQRGQEYYHAGAISNGSIQGNMLSGECEGTSAPYYHVRVTLDEGGIASTSCTCPYEFGGYCKHVVALLLTYVHDRKQFTERAEPADLLADLDRDKLIALLTGLMRDRPELYDWIEAALAVPSTQGKPSKKTRKPVDIEVHRRRIRTILHNLDSMRASEAYWHVGGLVQELDEVRDTAMKFLDAGDAESALEILLTLAEEAGDGIEYIDDSDGELGGFTSDLGLPLAEAILSLDLNAVEREKLRQRLEELNRGLGDYGMEEGIAVALEALDTGWGEPSPDQAARPAQSTHSRAEDEYDDEYDAEYEDEYDDASEGEHEAHGDDGGEVWEVGYGDTLTTAKLNVLERQGRTDEYLALCSTTGQHLRHALKLCDLDRMPEAVTYAKSHFGRADDALALAERLREAQRLDDAIALGEHGLTLGGSKASLGEWLGPIEEAQGRPQQALQAWLAAFPERPSLSSYKTIQQLAGQQWSTVQSEVMAVLNKSYDKRVLAEVLLHEEQWDEAIKVADGRDAWFGVAELVADAVVKYRPEWVAQMSIKRAEALMVAVKSKNYPIAASWLKRAKQAYTEMGKQQEWKDYLETIKEQYKRRPALQAQLQQL